MSIVERAAYLADLPLPTLREVAGFDTDSAYQARQQYRGMSRGELIRWILENEYPDND